MLSANRRKIGGKPSENDRKTVEDMSEYRWSRDTSHMIASRNAARKPPARRRRTGGKLPESARERKACDSLPSRNTRTL